MSRTFRWTPSRSAARLRRGAPLLWALTVAACADSAPPSRTDQSMMEARKQALERKALEVPPEEEESAGVIGEVPARVMADVREHLAGRTGAAADSFQVVRAESYEWPSGAMGCPQPDLVYTQRPVRGYWIVLEHEGREHDYRISDSGTLVLCEGMVLEDPPSR